MKRASLVLFTLLFACGPRTIVRTTSAGSVSTSDGAIVPATSGASAEEEAPAAAPAAWLWQVSGGDAAAPSYILGTMHVGIRMPDALPHPYDDHLHDARAVVMEVDFREAERFMQQSAHPRRGRRRTLDRELGEESWGRLVAELGQIVPGPMLRYAPASIVVQHLQQVRMAEVEAAAEGREPVPGVASSARLDATLFDEAVRQGTPIVPLETPAEALAALEAVADDDVLGTLHELIDQPDEARIQAAALRAAYLEHQEQDVLDLLAAHMTDAQREQLLIQRNRAWERNLFPQMQQGNAFVAVGLGHLLGPGSVIEALRAHGYTVERMDQRAGAPARPADPGAAPILD